MRGTIYEIDLYNFRGSDSPRRMTMDNKDYGVYSIVLGKTARETPGGIEDSKWTKSLVISDFYRAGAQPRPITKTVVKILYDQSCLHVLFENWEERDNEGEVRNDINRIAVCSGSFGRHDYSLFSLSRDEKTEAYTEHGMTYIGGDKALYMDEKTPLIPDRGERSTISPEEYYTEVQISESCWKSYLRLPWKILGGYPGKEFFFQAYRIKQQTGEILSPTTLEQNIHLPYWFEVDPSSYIIAEFGEENAVYKAKEPLVILSDGTYRFARNSVLYGHKKGEYEKLYRQITEYQPTNEANLREHLMMLQRLQDIFTMEGIDFFWDEAKSRSFEAKEPWNERHVINELFIRGEKEKAFLQIDHYAEWFRTYINWWYTDGTLGNIAEEWVSFDRLDHYSVDDNKLILYFRSGERDNSQANIGISRTVYLESVVNGIRIYTKKGFFDQPSDPIVETREGVIDAYERYTISIKAGIDWSVTINERNGERKVTFTKDSWKEYHSNGKDGQSIRFYNLESPVYGFGERFDAVDQSGKILAMWGRDCYMSLIGGIANQAYKNIPLIHIGNQASIFINSTYRMRADVCYSQSGMVKIDFADPELDLIIWLENSRQTMEDYANFTGKPLLPPKWVFEPWAGGGGGRWLDRGPLHDIADEQRGVLQKFTELDIPHGGFYAEGAGEGHDPKGDGSLYKCVRFAEEHGMHVFSWEYPLMTEERAAILLGDSKNLPVTKISGYEGKRQLPCYIDFTHPRAKELVKAQWATRFDAGIRGTMVDFGDLVPDEAVFYDGRTGKEMHDGFMYDYARVYREVFEDQWGDDHVLYQRGGQAGCQKYVCQFGGDQPTTFYGMKQSINGGLSVAASGLPFWGVDACGYDGHATADKETYVRWTAWACFCPIMRYHGTWPKEPWEYDAATVEIYKYYAWLRENLLTYLYSEAIRTHMTGVPMMRVLSMEFPNDSSIEHVFDEYMFGESLLVAPVYSEKSDREIKFPAGTWVSLMDNGEIYSGCDRIVHKVVPLGEIPVYIRAGKVIPMEMNENLIPGTSMTKSRIKALVFVLPEQDTEGTWFESSTERKSYCFTAMKNSMTFVAEGTWNYKYILVKGNTKKVRKLYLGEKSIIQYPAKQGLYFHQGWVRLDDDSIIIRVYPHDITRIRFEY